MVMVEVCFVFIIIYNVFGCISLKISVEMIFWLVYSSEKFIGVKEVLGDVE